MASFITPSAKTRQRNLPKVTSLTIQHFPEKGVGDCVIYADASLKFVPKF
jgi:hypothetical protein